MLEEEHVTLSKRMKRFVEQHIEITELGIGTGHPNGFVLYLSAPLVVPALIGLQQLGHEPEEHIGRRAGALLLWSSHWLVQRWVLQVGGRCSNLSLIFWWCELCCWENIFFSFLYVFMRWTLLQAGRHGPWKSHGLCRGGFVTPTDIILKYVFFQVTQGFLEYTKGQGNDLSTPRGGFPGLKPGDMWCLCAARWRQVGARHVWPCFLPVTQFVSWLLFSEKSFSLSLQAMLAGSAPRVVAAATHQASLQVEKSWCQNF